MTGIGFDRVLFVVLMRPRHKELGLETAGRGKATRTLAHALIVAQILFWDANAPFPFDHTASSRMQCYCCLVSHSI
jgi:hypothetical protein